MSVMIWNAIIIHRDVNGIKLLTSPSVIHNE